MLRKLFIVAVLVLSASCAEEKIIYFYSPSCHQCLRTAHEVIPHLVTKGFVLERYDLTAPENYMLLRKYTGDAAVRPPILVYKNRYYCGFTQIQKFMKLQDTAGTTIEQKKSGANKKLSLGMVTLGGLIDGINPCAFATIIFLIAFLAFRKYTKKEILLIGLMFCVAVYLMYILIGLGLMRGVYHLQAFYTVHIVFYRFLAMVCLLLGLLSWYDGWLVYTGKTSETILQLPTRLKKIIHTIIRSRL